MTYVLGENFNVNFSILVALHYLEWLEEFRFHSVSDVNISYVSRIFGRKYEPCVYLFSFGQVLT